MEISVLPYFTVVAFVDKVLHTEGIELEGIFTHFARADETDKSCARKQLDRFREFIRQIEGTFDYSISNGAITRFYGVFENKIYHFNGSTVTESEIATKTI